MFGKSIPVIRFPISVTPDLASSENVDVVVDCEATGNTQNRTISERNTILGRFFVIDFLKPFFMSLILVHAVALFFEGLQNLLCRTVFKNIFLCRLSLFLRHEDFKDLAEILWL